MKRIILCMIAATTIYSCANDKSSAKDEIVTQRAPAAADPMVAQGLSLVANSDCLSCHAINEPMAGPSYKAVAAKYENTPENTTTLAEKVIKGGMGNWGQSPMTPHPQLSQEDAKAMVKYIFSLKESAK